MLIYWWVSVLIRQLQWLMMMMRLLIVMWMLTWLLLLSWVELMMNGRQGLVVAGGDYVCGIHTDGLGLLVSRTLLMDLMWFVLICRRRRCSLVCGLRQWSKYLYQLFVKTYN